MSDLEQLIKVKIGRANKNLEVGKLLIDNGYCEEAINRLYYACFYAVQAVLLKKNIKPVTHKGVQQMFGFHYVKTKEITEEHGNFFSRIFQLRQIGDYADFSEFNEEIVRAFFKDAGIFIQVIEKIIEQE
ncbi:MAG: HEPN domain-containing protein [Niabella sp.]